VKMVAGEQGQKEMLINGVLRERARDRGLTAFLTSEYEWIDKPDEGLSDVCFLAFPYIRGRSLEKVLKSDDREFLSDEDLLEGLLHLLIAFTATSPSTPLLTEETVRFWHRDLKPDQVVIDESSKIFYLVDFGISQIEYKQGIRKEVVESSSTTGYESDLAKILVPIFQLIQNKSLHDMMEEPIIRFVKQQLSVQDLKHAVANLNEM